MEKKEFYRQSLPHFQQPGQRYFVTWSLKDAIPAKALADYSSKLAIITDNIKHAVVEKSDTTILKLEYANLRQKYFKAFDDLLDLLTKSIVDLTQIEFTETVLSVLQFWNGVRLENYAICVMRNHVHWVFSLFNKDENDQPVYLQDILKSVKRFSSNQINSFEKIKGTVWQKESWDTTIRDDRHLFNAVRYTIFNPVEAGLVKNWRDWKGTYLSDIFQNTF